MPGVNASWGFRPQWVIVGGVDQSTGLLMTWAARKTQWAEVSVDRDVHDVWSWSSAFPVRVVPSDPTYTVKVVSRDMELGRGRSWDELLGGIARRWA